MDNTYYPKRNVYALMDWAIWNDPVRLLSVLISLPIVLGVLTLIIVVPFFVPPPFKTVSFPPVACRRSLSTSAEVTFRFSS